MKFDIPKAWFVQSAEIEGDSEVGAGHLAFLDEPKVEKSATTDFAVEWRLAFGRFVELMRRKRGWTIQQLADKADIDVGELLVIEKNPQHEAELSTVHGLAKTLEIPAKRLIRMAGLAEERSSRLFDASLRFAASAESTTPLTHEEEIALQTYLKVVLEDSDAK